MGQSAPKVATAATQLDPRALKFVAARDNHIVVQHGNLLLNQYDYSFVSVEEYSKAVARTEGGRAFDNKHILGLVSYQGQKMDTFCSSMYRLTVYYEHCQHSLEAEIHNRLLMNTIFSQKEMWSLLCSCTLAFTYLQSLGISLGHITLDDIWLTEEGVVKVSNPVSVHNREMTVFKENGFYAPEQLDGSVGCNPYKS